MQRSRITISSIGFACVALFAMPVGTGHLEVAPEVSGYSAIIAPRFEVSYFRGQLQLDGHTLSTRHEQQLMRAARQLFGNQDTAADFEPLGVVPDHWASSTVQLLDALAATRSARAVLTNERLVIQGIAADTWPQQLEMLHASMPPSIEIAVDVTIPDRTITVVNLCARALTSHTTGAVTFEDSSTAFRNSAYGVLDRIIAMADACRGATISITGHTDSSGPETWNQHLSLARAQAVADYLAQRGLSRTRLVVGGAGSSVPVADNSTRYGRSLNRRIDIDLRPLD